jgi:hypothetical protein
MTLKVDLRAVAYTRAGDKGETNNVNVAPYDEDDYPWLLRHLTVPVVEDRFKGLVAGTITRYEMPGTKMVNFVMERALQGGVSRSLNIDPHGKSRASLMLRIQIDCPPDDPPPSGRGLIT